MKTLVSQTLTYVRWLKEAGTVRNYHTRAVEIESEIVDLEKRIQEKKSSLRKLKTEAERFVAANWTADEIAQAKSIAVDERKRV